jgi:hypothetical protein
MALVATAREMASRLPTESAPQEPALAQIVVCKV